MKANKILQTEGIIITSPHETLSSALSKLSSSHDAAFVFDDKKKYLGLVNPYHSVIRTSSPSNAKVEHCLFHAPHVVENFPSGKVAELMIESKVHYLPVFSEQQIFLGVVSARKLLEAYEPTPIFTVQINEMMRMKKRQLITVREDETIGHALHIFKQTKVSKLVVVNKEGRLKGILSYYDLISFLISPKKKERGISGEDKANLQTKRVSAFLKSLVLTLNPNDYARDALHLILEKKIGSIVVLNDQNKPVDIITTRDLLRLLIREKNKDKIIMTSKNLSLRSSLIAQNFFSRLQAKLKNKDDVKEAKFFVKEEKQGGLFKVVLSLFPKKGNPKVVSEEGKNLDHILQKVKKVK